MYYTVTKRLYTHTWNNRKGIILDTQSDSGLDTKPIQLGQSHVIRGRYHCFI